MKMDKNKIDERLIKFFIEMLKNLLKIAFYFKDIGFLPMLMTLRAQYLNETDSN